MVSKNNNNKALVCSTVLLGVTPFLSVTNYVCSAGGGPGFSINKDEIKLNFKIAKLVLIKAEDVKTGDVLMDDVDGHYLEKGKNGDYGYRRYETPWELVIAREEKEQADKYKGSTFEDLDYKRLEPKVISELTCKRKIIWVPAEKIMKLVKIEKVTKEVLKDIEKNIECGNRNEIYVTEDGKYKLEYVYEGRENCGKEKEIGYYTSSGWPDEKERDSQGIYTIDPESSYYVCDYYGGPY